MRGGTPSHSDTLKDNQRLKLRFRQSETIRDNHPISYTHGTAVTASMMLAYTHSLAGAIHRAWADHCAHYGAQFYLRFAAAASQPQQVVAAARRAAVVAAHVRL